MPFIKPLSFSMERRGSETASNAMNHSPDYRTGSLEAATAPPQDCTGADTRRYEIASAATFNVGEITQILSSSGSSFLPSALSLPGSNPPN